MGKNRRKKSATKGVPRRRVRQRKAWREDNMKEAIEAVRDGKYGYFKASNIYKVPRLALARLCCSDSSIEEAVTKPLGRKPVIPNIY